MRVATSVSGVRVDSHPGVEPGWEIPASGLVMMQGQQLRLIEITAVSALRRPAKRVVVEEVVRHHFEAGPVHQGYAGAAAASHLVVGVGRLMVGRAEVPQHNPVSRAAKRFVVEV